jgi:hypothetical protein
VTLAMCEGIMSSTCSNLGDAKLKALASLTLDNVQGAAEFSGRQLTVVCPPAGSLPVKPTAWFG